MVSVKLLIFRTARGVPAYGPGTWGSAARSAAALAAIFEPSLPRNLAALPAAQPMMNLSHER